MTSGERSKANETPQTSMSKRNSLKTPTNKARKSRPASEIGLGNEDDGMRNIQVSGDNSIFHKHTPASLSSDESPSVRNKP